MGVDYFVFGDVNSYEYGIDVFFKDIDHTPKRVYEIKEVPGRNGALYIDQNRYEDVSVAYDCIALDDADRKRFVNALAAQTGHKRLQDSFNDDEFYDAVFDGDIDPTVVADRDQSSFTVYFTRSPQRFLTSGETAVSVDDGDTLTNPTLFEAHPLLMAEGYGKIDFNGYEIKLIPRDTIGNIQLKEKLRTSGLSDYYTFDSSLVRNGDEITIRGLPYSSPPECSIYVNVDFLLARNTQASGYSNSGTNTVIAQGMTAGDGQNWYASMVMEVAPITFAMGVPGTFTASLQSSFNTQKGSNQFGQGEIEIETTVSYDGNNRIDVSTTRSIITDTLGVLSTVDNDFSIICTTTADSSVSALGHPTYIDCEIGEVYKIEGDSVVRLNHRVDLGSQLPKLNMGDNEITYDDTITDLQIIPRWWRV